MVWTNGCTIHILNFTSIPEVEKYHNVFHIKEKDSGLLYFKDLELHTIELKKFSKDSQAELADIVGMVKNSLDMWAVFLTRHDLLNKEYLPSEFDDPALKKALNVLDVMNFAPEEREAYEEHLKWLRVEVNTLKKYEAKGFAEGEHNKAITIAQKLLSQGMAIEMIARVTDLSVDEIKKLDKDQ
jgi:predicted transposase/invertase (TIGR01784 family)